MPSLDSLSADLPNPPMYGREPFKHTIKPLGETGNDDLYEMNTQSGSQVGTVYSRLTEYSGLMFR